METSPNPPSTGPFLSPRQRAIVAVGVTVLATSLIFAFVLGLGHLLAEMLSRYSDVLMPPVVAVVAAKVVQPLYDRLRHLFLRCFPVRLRENRRAAVLGVVTALAILVVLLLLIVPTFAFLWYFGKLILDQLFTLLERLPGFLSALWERKPDVVAFLSAHGVMPLLRQIDPAEWVQPDMVLHLLRERTLTLVGSVPAIFSALSAWLMVPVYLVVYLASRPFHGGDVSNILFGVSDRTKKTVGFLVDEFLRIVVGFFRGQVLVALIEGALFGLGYQFLAGLPYGLLLGLLVGLVNIIPYMGSIFVMPFVCLFAFFGAGGWGTLVPVLAVWGGVGLADFYITPKVQCGETGLGTFWVIFSLLFWGSVLGGFAGLFLAVPLSAFIAVLLRLLRAEYSHGA